MKKLFTFAVLVVLVALAVSSYAADVSSTVTLTTVKQQRGAAWITAKANAERAQQNAQAAAQATPEKPAPEPLKMLTQAEALEMIIRNACDAYADQATKEKLEVLASSAVPQGEDTVVLLTAVAEKIKTDPAFKTQLAADVAPK